MEYEPGNKQNQNDMKIIEDTQNYLNLTERMITDEKFDTAANYLKSVVEQCPICISYIIKRLQVMLKAH